MKGRIALLWHLHQPDYRDPRTGRPVLPWVRLHALRGYRDLLVETAERGTRWTINLVPCLLDQIELYAQGVTDDHFAASAAPAEDVDPAAIRRLPGGHAAMSDAHPHYRALRLRAEAGDTLSVAERRDLQVWATLGWTGATARRDYPRLRELIAKGRDFDESDKTDLFAIQRQILWEIPGLVRKVAQGPASVSVSPYFHPILPLLVDVRSAARAQPELPREDLFAWPDDALRQLTSARARGEGALGRAPIGLWPSEGSVSPEVIELVGRAGFRWLATDQGILAASQHTAAQRPGPWDLGHGVVGFFRDTDLSDRIGFQYATRPAQEAVAELVAVARQRARDGTLVVALDGENPWETYRDAGAALREGLMRELERDGIALDEAASHPPVGRVTALHTGSWIGANLKIWAGHEEDRAAWRLLGRTRAAVEAAEPALREAAMPHVLAAEGSDWFWWYGDDFETILADRFDDLFRAHLAAAWAAIGRPPPEALGVPVRLPRLPGGSAPTRFLEIDPAEPASWASWAGAGEVSARQGTMARGRGWSRIRYGWSRPPGALWIRVDVRGSAEGWRLEPSPDELVVADGALVAAYASGQAAFTLVEPSGEHWPELPVRLQPPPNAPLRWWDT